MRVYNFGSINIDHVYRVDHFVQPGETLASLSLETVLGGKGANQSVALARAGVEVRHIGRISESDQWAKESLQDIGVNTDGVELLDGPSGHAIIQVDNNGENSIVLHGGANQSFDSDALATLLKDAQAGDWLLLQNETNALNAAFAIAEQKQLRIAFNPAPMNDAATKLPFEQCDVLILNEVEAQQLVAGNAPKSLEDHEAIANALMQRFPDVLIALTLGGAGAMLLHKQAITKVSAPSVEAVDTTGAGDTFVGYFLAGIMSDLAPEKAMARACGAGALAVTVFGATPGIPSLDAVNKLNLGH